MKQTIGIALTIVSLVIALQAQTKQPRTMRELFMALPARYFSIECCSGGRTIKERKEQYLKTYLEIDDAANGYFKAGGDGAQDAIVMARFKRSDGSYLVGVYTEGEGGVGDTPWTIFLSYRNGRWSDVSRQVVRGYAKTHYIYTLPREGTIVTVYGTDENAEGYRGKKLYDLRWNKTRFVRK